MINIIFLLSIILNGFLLQKLILRNRKSKENFGLSLGVGFFVVFAVSQLTFILRLNVLLSILIYIILSLFLILKFSYLQIKFSKITNLSLFLSFITIFNIIFVYIESRIRPLIGWDGIASWFFGGKALYIDKIHNAEFYNYANFDFPFLFQSIVAFQSNINLGFAEENSVLLFPIIYIFLLLTFFYYLYKNVNLKFALIFTFLLSSTQEVIRHSGYLDHGHIDILLSYFILGFVALFMDFLKKHDLSVFFMIQIFLLGSAMTKNEGIMFYVLAQLFLILLISRKLLFRKYYLLLFLISISIVSIWLGYKALYLPENYRFIGPYFTFIQDFVSVFGLILSEFVSIQRWNLMWVFIFLSLPFIFRDKNNYRVFILLTLQLASYILIYFLLPIDPKVEIRGSFDRLLLHIYPSMLLISAISLGKIKNFNARIFKWQSIAG